MEAHTDGTQEDNNVDTATAAIVSVSVQRTGQRLPGLEILGKNGDHLVEQERVNDRPAGWQIDLFACRRCQVDIVLNAMCVDACSANSFTIEEEADELRSPHLCARLHRLIGITSTATLGDKTVATTTLVTMQRA